MPNERKFEDGTRKNANYSRSSIRIVDSIPLTNVTFLIFSKVDTWPTKGELEFREKGKGSKGQRVFFQAESDSAGWHS